MTGISKDGGIIYFRMLASSISYSIDTGANWTNVTSFPISIYNSNPGPTNVLSVEFTTDMTFTAVDQYFICGSEYITFDGKDTTSTFTNVVNCLGLIQNGTSSTDGKSNITVQNIHVASSGTTTLAAEAGWVCQSYFGKGVSDVLIDNCSSSGDIGQDAGGICGSYAGIGGSVTISNCYSEGPISGDYAGGICSTNAGASGGNATITNSYHKGDIIGDHAGGICGSNAGYNGGTATITNCYSLGQITGLNAGGICGVYAGYDGGTATITNCYSLGDIGDYAGGICGSSAGYEGSVTISNCYSEGPISGGGAGGICGGGTGANDGNATISNCYSEGPISGQYAGGICGRYAGSGDGNATIINCYSEGAIGGVDAGGICGQNAGAFGGTATISNCYSLYASGDSNSASGGMIGTGGLATFTNTYGANGTWSSTDANSKLTGTPTTGQNPGTTWAYYYIQDTPYILTAFVTIIQNAVILFRWVSSTLSYSINNGANWTNVTSFPISIYNSNPGPTNMLSVEFTTDMTFTAVDQYFICGSEYITFDGKDTTSTFSSVIGCLGLIQNGTSSTDGKSNITVRNINVASSGTTTLNGSIEYGANNAGWVCQSYFGRGVSDVLIDNCSSSGDIGANAGGICGGYAGASGGNATITNCYSEGAIGRYAGGICGSYAGRTGTATITNCYSEGAISHYAGGICGSYAGVDGGSATIENCYNLGDITGDFAGGICGSNAGGTGSLTISNSYSLYATGDSNSASGGMIGADGSATFTKTYGANGTWSSTDANSKLDGTPTTGQNVGPTWAYYIQDTPYILTAFYINMTRISKDGGIIYFRMLASSISYSIDNGATWTNVTNFPITIENSSPGPTNMLSVEFTTDMTFTALDQYFMCGSEYITFNGKDTTSTFTNVTDCLGLIQNGISSANGKSNITVQNINVASSGTTTLATGAGWVCQSYFGKGVSDVLIDNCSSSGDVGVNYAGGICGGFAGYQGNLTITNCYSEGAISGDSAGGICGMQAGNNGGIITISNSYSKGEISGPDAGGICGWGAGNNGGTASIINCYSEGDIIGRAAGGICGVYVGNNGGTVSITNSYSKGQIIGVNAGGLCGESAGWNCTITNCYSLYATGDSNSASGGMIGPNGSPEVTFTYTYGANGTWSSTDANSKLDGTPTTGQNVGPTWAYYIPNTPYILTAFVTIAQDGGIIYFRMLASSISYSIDTGANWTNVTNYPITIENSIPGPTNMLSVEFTTDMIFTAVDQYFICGSEYITFDGKDTTTTFSNVVNCLGLIQNGTSGADGKSNITVKNINVASSGTTTLAAVAGWVCQSYFGKGVSDVLIDNCSSSGPISGQDAGGICGAYAGRDGTATITNSYSSGPISGPAAGGICGSNAGHHYGTATITNCYSEGAIGGADAGGICGWGAGFIGGTASITNCYNLGDINGPNAGGICGAYAGAEGGTLTISNSYSLYATGDSNSASGGMIGPNGSAQMTFTNTYGANGTWSSTDANSKLNGTPTTVQDVGPTWAYYIPNTPYILTAFYDIQFKIYPFSNYPALENVSMNSITSITANTLDGCRPSLKIVSLGSVTSISDNAFLDCISLESFNIPGTAQNLYSPIFFGINELPGIKSQNGGGIFSGPMVFKFKLG